MEMWKARVGNWDLPTSHYQRGTQGHTAWSETHPGVTPTEDELAELTREPVASVLGTLVATIHLTVPLDGKVRLIGGEEKDGETTPQKADVGRLVLLSAPSAH